LSADRVVFDTNVLIRHGSSQLGRRGILSAVVLQEITAGAADRGDVRSWGTLARTLDERGRLLVPSGDDWFYTGQVLNALLRGARSVRGPRSHAIDKGEQQRLVRDVLIARSARRVNAAVVTYNASDFAKIRRFCNVRLLPPEDIL
jgi:predicted nucleic acid-binding protein